MKRRDSLRALAIGTAVALLGVVGLVSWAAGHYTSKTSTMTVAGGVSQTQPRSEPVAPQVAAGAHDFVQFACAQCHGEKGRGGVSPFVPALTQAGKQLTAAQLRSIIDHGLGESPNPAGPHMPALGEGGSAQPAPRPVAS